MFKTSEYLSYTVTSENVHKMARKDKRRNGTA